jgi:serine/threonine-protein kinase
MARFSREAQVLASLNHPNIASIHGFEEAEGQRALVMELVDGETIADRLKKGPIPVEEALRIGKQVAEALEEAHDRGIIHRDLKPANAKITSNGVVKLLDFGLAKALEGDPGSASSPEISQSPTFSAAATAAGMILGTAGYMSPEQARGQKVDRRSDIWSFGIFLYEMLSGRPVFSGGTVSDVLASVLKTEVAWEALPDDTPPSVRRLLQRCLDRDPKKRLQSIGEARILIDESLAGATIQRSAPAVAVSPPRRSLVSLVPWALFVAAAFVAGFFAVGSRGGREELPLRLSVELGERPLYLGLGSSAVLSPDGSHLAYVAGDDNSRELSVRALDQVEGTKIVSGSGTGAAPYHPFFSPDGAWLGYVTSSELRKVPVTGGTPLTLCKVDRSRGASWGPDDSIVFAPNPSGPLFRVSAAGGEPQALTTLDEGKKEATHRWPQFLPGGDAILFTSHTQSSGGFDGANLEVLVLATGERHIVQRGGSYGRYLPSGHLVYVNQGALFAVPFDLGKLEVAGSPAPMVQNVSWSEAHGGVQFSFSDTGRLAYVTGENTLPLYPIVWADRDGGTNSLWTEAGSYANPRLSPDGKRLALTVLREGNWDIWVYDIERGVSTRLTFEESTDTEQVWSPDGEFLIFSSNREGSENLYRKRADGSGDIERLTDAQGSHWAGSWSADGRSVAFMATDQGFDLWVLPLEGERKPEVFLKTPFGEADPSFSPDGRWIAYDSNESARSEVYVRPYPPGGGKWQVSDGGGAFPRWSRDGRRLYYRTDEGLMVASVETSGDTFRAGKPSAALRGAFRGGIAGINLAGNTFADYDVAGNGERFVMFPSEGVAGGLSHPHVTLVTHWFDELDRTLSVGGK